MRTEVVNRGEGHFSGCGGPCGLCRHRVAERARRRAREAAGHSLWLKPPLPISFGPVEYAQKQASAAAEVTAAQEQRIRVLEALNNIRDPADIEGVR